MKLKLIPLILCLLFTACNRNYNYYKSTVAVTNMDDNSGGSGTIISSAETHSEILTNSHVCEVVRNGGRVHREDGSVYFVKEYIKSTMHDLCLITVAENLRNNVTIASSAPNMLDESIVVGHPKLLPLIKTEGHFSGREIIQVVVGTRPCTDAEKKDPASQLFCLFMGKMPMVKRYDSVVVSNYVSPGSSGSAVYNASGELSAVIFAGDGEISYGFAVPLEYIRMFLDEEIPFLLPQVPNNNISMASDDQSIDEYTEVARKICLIIKTEPFCQMFQRRTK